MQEENKLETEETKDGAEVEVPSEDCDPVSTPHENISSALNAIMAISGIEGVQLTEKGEEKMKRIRKTAFKIIDDNLTYIDKYLSFVHVPEQ